MKRTISSFLSIVILSILLCSSTVFAEDLKNVTIHGLGTVDISSSIEVSEEVQKNGNKTYGFLVKDNDDVFHIVKVFCETKPDVKLGFIEEKPDLLAKFPIGKDRILKSAPLKSTIIGGKKVLTASITQNTGFTAYTMNFYFFENTSGVVMMMFACADSDVSYWETVRNSMIISARED